MSNYELIHYGIPGMKWGVRRTDAQLAQVKKERHTHVDRRAKERGTPGVNNNRGNGVKVKDGEKNIGGGKGKGGENTINNYTRSSTTRGILNDASTGFNAAARGAGSIENYAKGKLSKKQRSALDNMSDVELKARVNRMNLEKQYADLSSNNVARGASAAKMILEVAGSLTVIGSSAIGIAVGIDQLTGGMLSKKLKKKFKG